VTVYPWRITSRVSLPTLDNKGIMDALNTAVTTECLYWGVNYYDSTTDRQIELKRIGSPPAGEMSTFRWLVYGQPSSGSVHASANDQADASNLLFAEFCIDANTASSGPPFSYKANDPYSGLTGRSGGFALNITTPTTGSTLYVIESEVGLFFSVSVGTPASATSSVFAGFGRLWDENGTIGWCQLTPRFACNSAYPTDVSPSGYQIPGMQPAAPVNGGFPRIMGNVTGSTTRHELGRSSDKPGCANGRDGSALYRSAGGVLLPVTICKRVRASGLPATNAGRLLQLKYGPSGVDRATTADTIFVGGSPSSAGGAGIHFDQVAE
jgi:hypothetical protein